MNPSGFCRQWKKYVVPCPFYGRELHDAHDGQIQPIKEQE